MVEMRNSYKILVEKPEGKELLGRPKRRCKGCSEHCNEPSGSMRAGEFLE